MGANLKTVPRRNPNRQVTINAGSEAHFDSHHIVDKVDTALLRLIWPEILLRQLPNFPNLFPFEEGLEALMDDVVEVGAEVRMDPEHGPDVGVVDEPKVDTLS